MQYDPTFTARERAALEAFRPGSFAVAGITLDADQGEVYAELVTATTGPQGGPAAGLGPPGRPGPRHGAAVGAVRRLRR